MWFIETLRWNWSQHNLYKSIFRNILNIVSSPSFYGLPSGYCRLRLDILKLTLITFTLCLCMFLSQPSFKWACSINEPRLAPHRKSPTAILTDCISSSAVKLAQSLHTSHCIPRLRNSGVSNGKQIDLFWSRWIYKVDYPVGPGEAVYHFLNAVHLLRWVFIGCISSLVAPKELRMKRICPVLDGGCLSSLRRLVAYLSIAYVLSICLLVLIPFFFCSCVNIWYHVPRFIQGHYCGPSTIEQHLSAKHFKSYLIR